MEAYENLLDEVEANIQLIPDESEYKEALKKELKDLRQEFEEKLDIDSLLKVKISRLSVRVDLYMNGVLENPLLQEKATLPTIDLNDISEDGEEVTLKSKEENDIEILKAELLRVNFDEEVDAIRQFVDLIIEKYDELRKYSQDLEQAIENARYQVMLKYLKDSRIEEAQVYSKDFGTDMRIYIVNRLKEKIDELIKEGRLAEAEQLNRYVYGDSMQENDMKLWYLIAKIEFGEYKVPVVQEESKSLTTVQTKKNLWTTIVEKGEIRRKEKQAARERRAIIKQEKKKSKEKDIKVIRVRFDPNSKTGLNSRNVKKINKLLTNKRHKYKLIFDAGIKSIDGICFKNRETIAEVDLSKTNIDTIPYCCFK